MIEKLSSLILSGLEGKGLVELKADPDRVTARIREIITADMRAEEELDREVERLIASHSGDEEAGGVDYRKMFSMVKHKLARERGIVL